VNIVNPLVSDYLEGFYTPISEPMAVLRTYAEERHIPVITRDVERLLAVLLQGTRPSSILEIGTAIGYSAAFMAMVWEGCRIDSIEVNRAAAETAVKNLRDMGLEDRVHVIYGDATEKMETLLAEQNQTNPGGYDLIFIDASKSKYSLFFKKAMELVRPGGMILCDNVLMRGTVANDCYDPEGKHKTSVKNVRAFLNHITTLEEVETAILPIGDGVSMSIKKQP
jgi:predicted O-methyltransferase YrrM